jgi:1,6-anhydro-N-acetylmuramate kinase
MSEDTTFIALGLMSGTSCDGVGTALIETDGHRQVRPLAALTRPYPDAFRMRLRGALGDPAKGQAFAACAATSVSRLPWCLLWRSESAQPQRCLPLSTMCCCDRSLFAMPGGSRS